MVIMLVLKMEQKLVVEMVNLLVPMLVVEMENQLELKKVNKKVH